MSSEITNVSYLAPSIFRNADSTRGSHQTEVNSSTIVEDVVEFSEISRSLAAEVSSSSFRRARIEALRQQIAEGTYETPERLRGTVNRLLQAIR